MKEANYAEALGVRSRVVITDRMEDVAIISRSQTYLQPEGFFKVIRIEGDKTGELAELARIRTWESGFPCGMRLTRPWETWDENMMFDQVNYSSFAGPQNILVHKLTAPYMEESDWRNLFNGYLSIAETGLATYRKLIKDPRASKKILTFAVRSILKQIAGLVSETEMKGLLPEYKDRIERLQVDTLQFVRESGLEADPSIVETVRKTIGKYFEMDPLNPNLDAVETDVQAFGNILLPRGYGMTINRRHPKKAPRTIRTQAGVVLNLWEAEYFRV